MCISVSCGSFRAVLKYFPYVWLLLMPFYGSVWGVTCVARQSITFFTLISVCAILPAQVKEWIPCTEGLLLLLFICVPYSFIPNPLLWIYAMVLWFLEPFLLALESWQFVTAIHRLGFFQMDVIEENPTLGKGLVLTEWILFDVASVTLAMNLFYDLSDPMIWFLLVALLLVIILHIFTIFHDEGIISSAAFITFLSIFLIYVSWQSRNTLTVDLSYQTDQIFSEKGKSFMHLLLDLPQATTAYAHEPLQIFRHFFNWIFWIALTIRLTTLLSYLHRRLKEDEDWCFDETTDDMSILSGLRRPETLLQLTAVFLYTQMVVYQLMNKDSWWMALCPQMFRLIQSLGVAVVYMGTISSNL